MTETDAVYTVNAEQGSMAAMACVWRLPLDPITKLIAIGYADSPNSIRDIAEWAGVSEEVARQATERLITAGLVERDRRYDPVPTPWETLREMVFNRDGRCCRACGAVDNLTIDHMFPRVLGGSDDPENLQVLCGKCNSRKGSRVVGGT